MLPRDMTEILRRVRNGTFELRHKHLRLERTVNRLVLGILTASLFLGSSHLCAHKTPPEFHGISIIGSIGFVLALILGYRLLRVIMKDDPDKKK
jgi:ubiquinone biosynthesis protein